MSFEEPGVDAPTLQSAQAPRVTRLVDDISGPEKMAQFSGLLDRAFGLQAPARFLNDFPVWDQQQYNDPSKLLRIGIWEGPTLVSCAGVRLAMMHTPAGLMQVALIGAVATAESHRGLNLASNTLALAIQWAAERGAALAILWGSELGLYERLGFVPCGAQVRVPLNDLELGPENLNALRLNTGWNPVLLRSLQNRGSGIALTVADGCWLAAHRNVEWYWVGPAEALLAYAAVGRGIDLQNIVHEWGGTDQSALRELLCAVRARHPGSMLLGSPWMLRALGHEPETVESLCLAKALNPAQLTEHYGEQSDFARLPLWIWGLDAV